MTPGIPEMVTFASLAELQPLLPAEAAVVSSLRSGDFDRLGDGSRPEAADPGRIVRAGFLRFLLLGGEEGCRPHEKGVLVIGAWITGVLDLEGCRIPRDIGLNDCQFEQIPVLRSAIIDSLFLDGSSLPGLQAERLEARGGLYLRSSDIKGEVRIAGAHLGGNLEFDGASIVWPGGLALNAEGLEARSVLARGAHIRGGINLAGARLGAAFDGAGMTIEREQETALNADALEARGNLSLKGASITGEARMIGARIGGDLDCTGSTMQNRGLNALKISRALIEGGFLLSGGASVNGVLDMTGATIGTIHDETGSWPGKGDLLLNRCIYAGFIDGPVNSRDRLEWLSRQSPDRWNEDFWPQPYEQLATVFREMGHDEDARAVLVEKERLQRRARRQRTTDTTWRTVLAAKDGLLGLTLGYGRQPLLAFVWLAVFWLVGVGVFAFADRQGALKPNSPVVLRSPEWTLCSLESDQQRFLAATQQWASGRAEKGQTQLDCFRSQFEVLSYPPFNEWMYSLDTLFPVLEIGQKEYWRPDPTKPWGSLAMGYFYFESVVGWALSLLAVAGFSGLVKSR